MSLLSILKRWTGPAAPPPPKGDPGLRELNLLMLSHYGAAKEEAIRGLGPVIVAGFSEMLLVWDGRRELVSCYDETTANLKFMAHTALAIDLLVSPHMTPSSKDTTNSDDDDDALVLPEPQRAAMKTYHATLGHARARIEAVDFTPEQRERQKRIVQSCDAIAEALASEKGIARAKYEALLKEAQALAMINVDDAASRMLEGLNDYVAAWRELLGPTHWKDLRVVVCGNHQIKNGYLPSQYFERMFHRPSDDHRTQACDSGCRFDSGGLEAWDVMDDHTPRLFFMEGSPRPNADVALDFLATHIVDAKAGQHLFGDPRRLHRDVLADASAKVLKGMTLPAFP